ncbi:MAG: FAD-dependent oxidoreductase [Peptococcaceae bacterium]|nr:FAD-dependent oxidoreductase [Peptococcaceae bacterium]
MVSGIRILIIGGLATGPKAAARARRLNPDAEITIIEQGDFVSYSSCGIPYYIGGQIPNFEDLVNTPVGITRNPAYFDAVKGIKVLLNTKAVKIDREQKKVYTVRVDSGEETALPYDKLVIATGSRPRRLPFEGMKLKNVSTVWTLDDARKIREQLINGNVKKVVIIGAGLIGLETAEAIRQARNIPNKPPEVTVLEALPHIAPAILDPEISDLVRKRLKEHHISIHTNTIVRELEGDENGKVRQVITDQGNYPADLVLVTVGATPNVALAEDAGLKIGITGAIAVNEYLQTSDPDIYAGGDCVENINLITGKPAYYQNGAVANRHGRVIGTNLAGGKDIFPGVLGTTVFKIFDHTVGRTGLTERQAREEGFEVITSIVGGSDHAHFYPDARPLVIKLIADRATRRLLGAQLVGTGNVDKRLDTIAVALSTAATVDQIANFDLAYAPPYNAAMDVLHHAANTLRNKLDGWARSIGPQEASSMLQKQDDIILVDVRTSREFEKNPPPFNNVAFIPLGKLRAMSDQLPKDKELLIYCQVSQRAWEAQRILQEKGFEKVRFIEGGLLAWPY